MTLERKKKLHKILLICFVSILIVILLTNAVLLYLFIPISPKNVNSIWHNDKDFSDYFYFKQYSRLEFFQLFSSEENVLIIEFRFKYELLDTVKRPQEENYETWDEYRLAAAAYPELLKAEREVNYKKFIKTYQLDTLPLHYRFYIDEFYAGMRFYVDDSATVSTYRSYIDKLETMQNDPIIDRVEIGYNHLDDYWTEHYRPIGTLFE